MRKLKALLCVMVLALSAMSMVGCKINGTSSGSGTATTTTPTTGTTTTSGKNYAIESSAGGGTFFMGDNGTFKVSGNNYYNGCGTWEYAGSTYALYEGNDLIGYLKKNGTKITFDFG